MRVLVAALIGAVAGFLGGIVLTEVIAIAWVLAGGDVADLGWMRPVARGLAAAGLVLGPVVDARVVQRRGR